MIPIESIRIVFSATAIGPCGSRMFIATVPLPTCRVSTDYRPKGNPQVIRVADRVNSHSDKDACARRHPLCDTLWNKALRRPLPSTRYSLRPVPLVPPCLKFNR
jgi:hypothetical protein